jgi:UV DNA damage endonuclease
MTTKERIMEMPNLGYACILTALNDLPKSERVTTNRSMVKRTFLAQGLPYASELALQNCKDLLTILEWNE